MSKRRKGARGAHDGLIPAEHAWEQDSEIVFGNKIVGLYPVSFIPIARCSNSLLARLSNLIIPADGSTSSKCSQ